MEELRFALLWMAVASAGCSALLDMPAPQLFEGADASLEAAADVGTGETRGPEGPDAGADGSFDVAPEATADVALDTATVDALSDAALDQSADAPQNGLACGFGLSCGKSALPYCCETRDDAGAPVFGCVSSESACPGYYVECTNENDCPNNDICCHYSSGMRCESPGQTGSCPGGSAIQACDPANSGECPARQACTMPLTIDNVRSPYMGCQ